MANIERWDEDLNRGQDATGGATEYSFQEMIDFMPALAWSSRPDGAAEFFNRGWLEYTGLLAENALGWGWTSSVHPDDVDRLLAYWQSQRVAGEPAEIEGRLRRFDGNYRWFLFRARPVRDAGGRVTRWFGTNTDIDDRKRAEDTLRDSERKFNLLVETIPALVWRGTPAGELDYLSQRAIDYLGETAEKLSGERWLELVHPDHREATTQKWLQSVTTGTSYEDVYQLRRADGQYRWIQSVGEPFHDAGGRIAHWYGLVIDIHDRKRTEDALAASESQLRLMVDTIPALVCTMNAQGELETVNRQVVEYMGKSSIELRDWAFIGTVHEEDLAGVVARWRHSVESGERYDIEHRIRRADGVFRWFDVRGLPLRDANNAVVRWYVLLTDIEDRKRAEQATHASEARLRLIIDAIPALVWRTSAQGEMEYVNKRATDYTGESFEDAVHSGLTTIHPDDRDTVVGAWMRAVETSEPFSITYRLRGVDGIYRWFDAEAEPLRDADGRVLNWFGLATNVDENRKTLLELRETRDKLARASRMATVAELSASIAHEINQPLAAIVSNGEAAQAWLGHWPPDLERARTSLERIVRDGHAAADVVGRIRGLFKHARPAKELSDINAIVRETLRLVDDEIREQGTIVNAGLAEDLPLVPADRIQIQHALLNLVHNAIEAMQNVEDRTRALAVTSERKESHVVVRVSDQGSGVSDAASMFDPFVTTKAKGMGMGLSICRSIIEAHGGQISWSANDGPGSTFGFTLPIDEPL